MFLGQFILLTDFTLYGLLFLFELFLELVFHLVLDVDFDFVFYHFNKVVFLYQDSCRYKDIYRIIDSSFDVPLISLLGGEIVDENFRYLVVGQFSVFKKEFRQFRGYKFESFYLIATVCPLSIIFRCVEALFRKEL